VRELPFFVDLWEAQNLWYMISRHGHVASKPDPQWDERFHLLGTKLDIEVGQLAVDK
jgi:hypothetical protein